MEISEEPEAKKLKLSPTEETSSTNDSDEKLDQKNDNKKPDSPKCQEANTKKETEPMTTQSSDKSEQKQSRVQEPDVGITEYISSCPGFQGVIKQRYSDFLVNEISKDGRVVHLTNSDLPQTTECTEPTDYEVPPGLLSDEEIEKLKELLKSSKEDKKSVLISVGDDRDHRSKIHHAIEKGFPGLQSSTIVKANEKFIEASLTNNKGSGLRNWPKGRGDYCKFVLYKEAKDTMDAVGILSNKLRLKGGLFQYAGTKDKRSKSSQELTAYRVAAEKLIEANRFMRNIVCGNFSYSDSKLSLGQLQGNRFTIVLRSVTGTQEQIEAGMKSLTDIGFINYYGMQRFGVYSIPTHHIGRALLSCNWKEAVELILKPKDGEDKTLSEARKRWWTTRNSQEAMSKFPKSAYIERNILLALSKSANDYMGAMQRVARNTRLMYVHAYQSYIWNTVVSHRIKEHGLQPVCGDLVIPHKAFISTEDTDTAVGKDDSEKITPTLVDSSNIGDYTIYDVVLPKPGYAVIYPGNDIEILYKDLMEKDQLDYQNMKTKYKDYSLSGDYRHILVKPQDVEWRVFRYNDVSIPLALSDMDILKGEPEPQSLEDGTSVALRLQLTLPTSCYATMALRELLKIDTSCNYQASLNAT